MKTTSWWEKRQEAARQRRELVASVRRDGWFSDLIDRGRKFGRDSGEKVRRITSQATMGAKKAGITAAMKVLGVQASARLNEKLVQRSAASVLYADKKGPVSKSHSEWAAGYESRVRAARPGLLAEPEKAAAGPDRPVWPFVGISAEKDDPEAGS